MVSFQPKSTWQDAKIQTGQEIFARRSFGKVAWVFLPREVTIRLEEKPTTAKHSSQVSPPLFVRWYSTIQAACRTIMAK